MGVVILNLPKGTGESCSSEINSNHINMRNKNSFCQGVNSIEGEDCHREIGSERTSVESVALLQSCTCICTCIMSISFLSAFKNPPVLVTLVLLK